MEQFWLYKLSGLLRVDLFSSSPKAKTKKKSKGRAVRPTVQLCISTVKSLSFHVHITGLRVVQKSRSSRPTVHNFDRLIVHGEVDIYALFLFRSSARGRSKRWQLSPLSKVVITKLKTHMLSVTDKLLQTVINGILPSTILNAILELLPEELGRILTGTDASRDDHKQGLAVEVDLQLRGSPTEAEFQRDLTQQASCKAAAALGFGSTAQVLSLRDCLVELGLHREQKLCLGDLLPLRSKLERTTVQELLDKTCTDKRIESWSIDKVLEKLEEVADMQINVELCAKGLDLKMEVDRSVSMLREFLWRTHRSSASSSSLSTQAKVEEELKSIHHMHQLLTFIVTTVKEMSQRAKLVLTGSASGGKYPVYELCLRDLVVNGVLDLSIVNCRVGGSMQELMTWIQRLFSRLESSPEHTENLSDAVAVMEHLEFVQFFLDIELLHIAKNDGKASDEDSLFLTMNGQRDNPRPPLTVHVLISARELLRKLDSESVGGMSPFLARQAAEYLEAIKLQVSLTFPAEGAMLKEVLAQEQPSEERLALAFYILPQWTEVDETLFNEILMLSYEVTAITGEDHHDRESNATTVDSDQSTTEKDREQGRQSVCTLDSVSGEEDG